MYLLLLCALLAALPAMAWAQCPTGCTCNPGQNFRCRVTEIPNFESFSVTPTSVDFSDVRFSSPVIQKTNFSSLTNVDTLYFKNCGISTIGYRTFADLTKLKFLDLTFNNLNVIAEGALTGLKLNYLYLDDNPTIRLPDNAFTGMTTGYLSLKKCNIEDIRVEVFKPLGTVLRKIYLDGNKIERFSHSMLSVFQGVDIIRIFDNPLICDCESRWLKEFYDLNVNSKLVREPSIGSAGQEPRCAEPGHVRGRFFNQLTIDDFTCDMPTLHAGITFTNKEGLLSCVSRGNPLPSVAWYRPNGVISRSVPRGNMATNTNEIKLLAHEANVRGQYRCVAANDGGNISLTVDVDWPFQTEGGDTGDGSVNCNPDSIETTPRDIDLTNSDSNAEQEQQTDVFKMKHFTLVDLVGAILGTFVSTLIVTIVTLHFCVYRRRKMASQYTTPPMSEYSSNSSNGSDKHSPYPLTLHSLQSTHSHMHPHPQRPLPNKPLNHKIYDENHYMATNVDEHDEFIRQINGRITPASTACDTCQGCRSMGHHMPHVS